MQSDGQAGGTKRQEGAGLLKSGTFVARIKMAELETETHVTA